MQSSWRLIHDAALPAAENMARDLALTQAVRKPVLHLYRWNTPSLSIGYHQSTDKIKFARCRHDGVAVVRRPTGGRAVLHVEEITYAVILPKTHHLMQKSIREAYRILHQPFAALLRSLKIETDAELVQSGRSHDGKSQACFASALPYEPKIKGRKILGSAQRRFPGGLLQHGSFLLGGGHLRIKDYLQGTPEKLADKTTFLRENTATLPAQSVLEDRLITCFRETLAITLSPSALTSEELELTRLAHKRLSLAKSTSQEHLAA